MASGSATIGNAPSDRYLVGRRSRVGMRAGLVVSIAAHLAMFGGALLYANLAPPRVVPEKPIVARLVRLGTPRDQKLLPRLPNPTRAPEATGKPSVPTPPTAKSDKALPKEPSLKERAEAAIDQQKRLEEALAKLGPPPDGPTAKTPEPEAGQKDGDVQGDAESEAEGDRYVALVAKTLRDNFKLPDTIPEKQRMYLAADLVVRIAPDGRILDERITRPSENPQFDNAILAILKRMTLPPPPPAFLAMYKDGLPLHYHP